MTTITTWPLTDEAVKITGVNGASPVDGLVAVETELVGAMLLFPLGVTGAATATISTDDGGAGEAGWVANGLRPSAKIGSGSTLIVAMVWGAPVPLAEPIVMLILTDAVPKTWLDWPGETPVGLSVQCVRERPSGTDREELPRFQGLTQRKEAHKPP
jgi:hypothetical protein